MDSNGRRLLCCVGVAPVRVMWDNYYMTWRGMFLLHRQQFAGK